jgi:two-component system response regulator DctR
LLEAQGHQSKYFQSTEGFLDTAKPEDFDCILLELWFKSGISGLDFLRRLVERGGLRPTVMMSALADPDSAFAAAKMGASAMLAKPLRGLQVAEALRQATAPAGATGCTPQNPPQTLANLLQNPETLSKTRWNCLLCRAENRLESDMFGRLESLSPTEAKVFLLLALDGKPTKCLAAKLNIGDRTAETHRSNIFRKLGMRYPVELRGLLENLLKVAN